MFELCALIPSLVPDLISLVMAHASHRFLIVTVLSHGEGLYVEIMSFSPFPLPLFLDCLPLFLPPFFSFSFILDTVWKDNAQTFFQ